MPHGVVITGLGLTTSIGWDVTTACASLRAGLTRPAHTEVSVEDDDEMDSTPVVGHPVVGLTDGFWGPARLARLGGRAVEDLIAYARIGDAPTRFWQRTGLWLAASSARYDELEVIDEVVQRELAGMLWPAATPRPGAITVCLRGHAAALHAAAEASRAIEARELDRALVLGVDSLLDPEHLEGLLADDRLKWGDNPVGLMPGEAAGAFLLESWAEARARQARVEGVLEGLASASGPAQGTSDRPAYGRALADALMRTNAGRAHVQDIYVDLNGEESRARDWGHALVRLRGHGVSVARTRIPAVSLGDTGAASGAIAVCAAVRSHVRRYARGPEVLICSSSEDGEVRTGCVRAASLGEVQR